VHLVGFITKKFVMMHGHMNIKSVMKYSQIIDLSMITGTTVLQDCFK